MYTGPRYPQKPKTTNQSTTNPTQQPIQTPPPTTETIVELLEQDLIKREPKLATVETKLNKVYDAEIAVLDTYQKTLKPNSQKYKIIACLKSSCIQLKHVIVFCILLSISALLHWSDAFGMLKAFFGNETLAPAGNDTTTTTTTMMMPAFLEKSTTPEPFVLCSAHLWNRPGEPCLKDRFEPCSVRHRCYNSGEVCICKEGCGYRCLSLISGSSDSEEEESKPPSLPESKIESVTYTFVPTTTAPVSVQATTNTTTTTQPPLQTTSKASTTTTTPNLNPGSIFENVTPLNEENPTRPPLPPPSRKHIQWGTPQPKTQIWRDLGHTPIG